MSRKTAYCSALLPLVCGALLVVPASAQHSANPANSQDAKSTAFRGIGSPVVSDPTKAQAILDYWSPDRLSNARPLPIPILDKEAIDAAAAKVPVNGPSGGSPGGRPSIQAEPTEETQTETFPLNQGDADESAPSDPPGFNYVYPYNNFRTGVNNTYPYSTVGKLFFIVPSGATLPPGEYVCTASVAMNSYTLVTSRQCMYDVNTGKWYGSFVFYPGWNSGKNSKLGGAWTVRYAWTWPTGYANYYYDIGFLALNDHNGQGCDNSTGSKSIGHYTGWLGNWYGEDYSQLQWSLFGYPTTNPFNGNYLYQDNAATAALNPFGFSGTVGVGNPQAGGITGGPWVLGFDPNNASSSVPVDNINANKNLINSVISYKSASYPLMVVGPEFESNNFSNLYGGYLANNGCN